MSKFLPPPTPLLILTLEYERLLGYTFQKYPPYLAVAHTQMPVCLFKLTFCHKNTKRYKMPDFEMLNNLLRGNESQMFDTANTKTEGKRPLRDLGVAFMSAIVA